MTTLAVIVLWGFSISALVAPDDTLAQAAKWQSWVTQNFAWLYIGTQNVWAFFLLYVSVFTGPAAAQEMTRIPEGAPGHEAAELSAVAGLAGYVVTTLLLVAPLLLAQRVGRRPRGAVVMVVGAVAWLSAAVGGFTPYGVSVAAAVSVAAIAVEAVVTLIERSRLPRILRLPAFAASVNASGIIA